MYLLIFYHHKKVIFLIGLALSFMMGSDPLLSETQCMWKSSTQNAIEAGRLETQRSFETCTSHALSLPVEEQEQAKKECRRVMNVFLDSIYAGRTTGGDNVFMKK